MAKKRKSKEEKIKADTRHFHYHFEPSKSPTTAQKESVKAPAPATTLEAEKAFLYLIHDLRKTLLLTASIIAIQVAIFLIMKVNTIPFLGISY